jgi:hypothetical protein
MSVATLDGVVRVGDATGANSIDVGPGKQITVQKSQAPNKLKVMAINGKLDPALESLLSKAKPPSSLAGVGCGTDGLGTQWSVIEGGKCGHLDAAGK